MINTCIIFLVVPSYLHAVRSLSIIGAILLLFSTALGLYVATRKYNQSSRYVDNLLFGLLVSASKFVQEQKYYVWKSDKVNVTIEEHIFRSKANSLIAVNLS